MPPTPAAETPEDAFRLLTAGNARFVAGESTSGPLTQRRLELTGGQAPYAIILGCSDSRVPIETIFDQVPGHLFVVRLAGNFVTAEGLGSIEYGVAVLRAHLIVVLGHQSCGAVDATVQYVRNGTTQPGHIMELVRAIEPAVNEVKREEGDWVDNAIRRNVRNNVNALKQRSTILADAIRGNQLEVAGGVYDLHTGRVTFS
jgi:carbonic anhydrase